MPKTSTFYARIRLKKDNKYYPVSVEAKTASDAKKLIIAQYGSRLDRFANQPRKDKPYT